MGPGMHMKREGKGPGRGTGGNRSARGREGIIPQQRACGQEGGGGG